MNPQKAGDITRALLLWYDQSRRSFVFRGTREPYEIWLSEIMLQQTRTDTVEPYYSSFLVRFPDVFALAAASEEEVLKAWQGLGYYTRARNLLKAARLVVEERGGVFPQTAEDLKQLPGVGDYAAAAIASIAYDEPVPAMDGNLSRVISRLDLVTGDIGTPQVKRELYELGLRLMPKTRAGDMNQALMDLGATICLPGTPDCVSCPLNFLCKACQEGEPADLPRQKAKKPPVQVPVSVLLAFHGDRVLLVRRKETLLRGLYVFLLKEGADGPEAALSLLRLLAPRQIFVTEAGQARHVFTHRVWNMRVYTARVNEQVAVPDGVWVNREELSALPLPVAMKTAAAIANEELSRSE